MYDERGVTLLEVIVIIAVIGVLAVMSIPRLSPMGRNAARIASRQIIADMRYARQLAVSAAKNHIVRFSPAGGPYTGYSIIRVEGAVETPVGETRQIPAQVNCTGSDEFTFSPLGAASMDGTISLAADGDQYDVNVIGATGRVY